MLYNVAFAEQKVVTRRLCTLGLTAIIKIIVFRTTKMISNARMPADSVAERRGHTNSINELEFADFVQELGAYAAMDMTFARNA